MRVVRRKLRLRQLSPRYGGEEVIIRVLRRATEGRGSSVVMQCAFDQCTAPNETREKCGVNAKRFGGESWFYCAWEACQKADCTHRRFSVRSSPSLHYRMEPEDGIVYDEDGGTLRTLAFIFRTLMEATEAPGKLGIASTAWMTGEWEPALKAFASHDNPQIAAQRVVAEHIAKQSDVEAGKNRLRRTQTS